MHVQSVNDAPSNPVAQDVVTKQGTAVDVSLSATDVDNVAGDFVFKVTAIPPASVGQIQDTNGVTLAAGDEISTSPNVRFVPNAVGTAAPYQTGTFDVSVSDGSLESAGSTTMRLFVYPPPRLDAVEPSRASPGATITLKGAFFEIGGPLASAFVGSNVCGTLSTLSDTRATCVVPPGVGENVDVQVTSALNLLEVGLGLFDYAAPDVTSLSVVHAAPGATITLHGTGFGPSAAGVSAWIDGTACTSTTHVSATQVICVVPAGTGSGLDAAVIAGAQQSAANTLFRYTVTDGPEIGGVFDGPTAGVDIDVQAATQLSVSWSGIVDNAVGVQSISVAIGSSAGASDVAGAVPVGNTDAAGQFVLSGTTVAAGSTYYVTIVAVNEDGVSSTQSSDGVYVDGTGASAGTIYDPYGSVLTDVFWTDAASVPVTWDAFTDGESGIAGYAVVLKTVGGSVVYGPTNVGLALAHNATGLRL